MIDPKETRVRVAGAESVAQFRRHVFVEAFDRRQLVELDIGDFLEFGEAFGDEQLRQRFVDVEADQLIVIKQGQVAIESRSLW